MEKITYLLGAGFSAPAGLPLMNNFILKAKDVYYSDSEKYKHFLKIFEKIEGLSKIKNFFASDLYNIEEVLSLLETETVLYRNSNIKDEFIRFIIDVIEYYTFENLGFRPLKQGNPSTVDLGDTKIKRNYASFVCSISGIQFCKNENSPSKNFEIEKIPNIQNRYSIITLNYDTILENCLDSIKDRYYANFDLSFNKEKYDPDWTTPHLIKLHGCVREGNIIPPTWAKSNSPQIEKNWRNAYNIIKDSSQIRFIGYSLPITDSNVRYLIKSAILKNQTLKKIDVLCLDNPMGQYKNRYKEFIEFNYYDYRNVNTIDFLIKLNEENTATTHRSDTFTRLESVHNSFLKST
jgi:hypothetical protein